MVGSALSWCDVAIAIPTVAGRRAMLGELVGELRAAAPAAVIVTREHVSGDPARVDFPATIDFAFAAGRRWILALEDDVWPAPTFGSAVCTVLRCAEAAGASAASLFSRSKRDAETIARDKRWRWQSPSSFSMSQAVAVRADALGGFAAWAPSWYAEHPEHNRAADLLLGAWLSRQRARMIVATPSLAQHRRGPSTLPGHHGARQSETYRAAFGEVP